jgi:hypothetical protein
MPRVMQAGARRSRAEYGWGSDNHARAGLSRRLFPHGRCPVVASTRIGWRGQRKKKEEGGVGGRVGYLPVHFCAPGEKWVNFGWIRAWIDWLDGRARVTLSGLDVTVCSEFVRRR